jgi:hypothetical protein
VEEELARCDPDQRPNHILLFTILNAQYTIDVSILYKAVLRIPYGRPGSRSVCQRGLDTDPDPFLSPSKNSKKKLDYFCFLPFFDFLSLKTDVNVPSKSIKQKTFFKNLFC